MTELLFGLTIALFGYVVYGVLKTLAAPETGSGPPAPAPALPEPGAEASAEPPSPGVTPAAESPAEAAPPAASAAPERAPGDRVRNPATGEVAPIPGNYRFAKKWIKEALVAEGLLDRVYKSSELDGAAAAKVREALARLRKLDRYQA